MKTNEQRINNIIGQLEAFKKNTSSSSYDCFQKIIQLKAIRSALSSLSEKIIQDELKECLFDDGNKKNKDKLELIIKEILKK